MFTVYAFGPITPVATLLLGIMIVSLYISSALLWSTIYAAESPRPPRWEPLPWCDDCVSREDILAPGIGFDVTLSYATAAIRYDNGSTVNLVKVEADDDCRQLSIRMLKTPAVRHCWNGRREELSCRLHYAKRLLNKLLGRPATPDVGTIAELLKALRLAAEDKLGSISLKRAQLAIPFLPGFSHDDWRDAMEHVGLELLSNRRIGDEFSESDAAFAGAHYGQCEHYDNLDDCEAEEAKLPFSHVLAVSLSRVSFSAACSQLQSAEASHGSHLYKQTIRVDLGLETLQANSTQEDQAVYWSQIQETIVDVGRESRQKLNALLLLGEEGFNPALIRVVQDALRELLLDALANEISGSRLSFKTSSALDPLWLAARGSAELAKRIQEAPHGCCESARCADLRRRDRTDDQDSRLSGQQRPQLEL